MSKERHYGAIDGLRAIACLGIVIMHLAANNDYEIGKGVVSNFLYKTVIHSFNNLTFLFMTISAFGMCCGYYEGIKTQSVSISDFYNRRFKKIWPFFAILVMLDLIASPSINSVYEAFADLTIMFGFLPNAGNIEVIGVGWFLGVIFVFYLIFPFFCYILENKNRAWTALCISLIYNFVCTEYFNVERRNILYCSCYFMAGGITYLYRDKIEEFCDTKIKQIVSFLFVAVSIVLYYAVGGGAMCCLLVSLALLWWAVANRGGYSESLLNNKVMHFFSAISMEVYLSHMFVFRVGEKLRLNTIFGNGLAQYLFTVAWTLFGAIVFSLLIKRMISIIEHRISVYKTS